jgi:hypothetical protein
MDPGDHRGRARVNGFEHVRHGHRVVLITLDVEGGGRAHPVDVGSGTERRPGTRDDDHPEVRGALAGEGREGRASSAITTESNVVARVGPASPGQRHRPVRSDRRTAWGIAHRSEWPTGCYAAFDGSSESWSPNWRPTRPPQAGDDPDGPPRRAPGRAPLRPGWGRRHGVAPGHRTAVDGTRIRAGGLAGLAGVSLLGAGLAPAAVGSGSTGAVVGLALALGVPVAAVTSALIGTWLVGSALDGFDEGGRLAGQVLRSGVSGAVSLAPLIALASATWVVVVRRWAR